MTKASSQAGKRGAKKPATIDAYLASAPAEARAGLRRLREAVRASAPRAEECISYGVPAFSLGGRPFVWFAAWRHHWSLYPIPRGLRRDARVAAYEASKGTLRFPLDESPPIPLIKRIVKALVAERRRAGGSR
jgi:uncharacterized protein YdhG (YjbR/CyaY superfamily)